MRPDAAPSSSAWRSLPSWAGSAAPRSRIDEPSVARERRNRELGSLQHADRADDRRRVDRRARVLVVQRDVARDDGSLERLTGLGHPRDGLAQGVRRPGPLGVAEVEAVGDRGRVGAAAGDVQDGLRDRLAAAATRIERHAGTVAVEGHRDGSIRRRQPHDRRIAPGPQRRCPSRRAGRTGRTPRPWSTRSGGRAGGGGARRRRPARRSSPLRAARPRGSRACVARAGTWARRRALRRAGRRRPRRRTARRGGRPRRRDRSPCTAARGGRRRPRRRPGERARRPLPCAPATPRS